MTTDPRLENYLAALEEILKPFPVSDRAEIIMEIKSHVLSALERDSGTSMDVVLAALGEPETVANRYLMERGLQPTKPPVSPIVKWLVIGFMSTVAMFLLFVVFLITQFQPLVKVDESSDKISVLGGLIEVDSHGGVLIDSFGIGRNKESFDGSMDLDRDQNLSIHFKNGRFELKNSEDFRLEWECRGDASLAPAFHPTRANENGHDLDFTGFKSIDCEISIPEKLGTTIGGINGQISLENPHFHVNGNLTNGIVSIRPDKDHNYHYNLKVNNGTIGKFESSSTSETYNIEFHLDNGMIQRK